MIKQKQAPANALAPLPIAREGHAVPDWLGNEDFRKGIKAMVELDRCIEEEYRLSREHCAMQEWMFEEWQTLICW